ncbi:hypothetical protein PF008_g11663 [Phytophthora fragariae]|uniref:Uncharacterized protein n=2 Tax=Phytophthora TaxID=4783 RepID=A0A6A3NET5_9STRA|nr:hypothetical protein PR002_g4080 [Phytophthora rubi]KAE9339235.1 hypothetical protein PF008_g11663 [Phytophthora fragariae]
MRGSGGATPRITPNRRTRFAWVFLVGCPPALFPSFGGACPASTDSDFQAGSASNNRHHGKAREGRRCTLDDFSLYWPGQ